MIRFYEDDFTPEIKKNQFKTRSISIIDTDTFSAAAFQKRAV